MAARKYWVDWEDSAYPEIRPIEDASEYAEPLTLADAKHEVITHFQYQIDHARDRIRHARSLRASDITSRAGEDY